MEVTREPLGPPAGHSVIHKMRPFYRPPPTLAFVAAVSISGSENGKWRLRVVTQNG